jgi:hypothetical protein
MRGLLFAAGVAVGVLVGASVASAATLNASQIAATYSALGYHIQSIELNDAGTVYEIQATAPNGFPVELFADAATGSQVGSDGGGGGVQPGTKGDDVADNSETGDGVDTSGDGDTGITDGGGTDNNGGGDSGDSGTGGSGDGGGGGGDD